MDQLVPEQAQFLRQRARLAGLSDAPFIDRIEEDSMKSKVAAMTVVFTALFFTSAYAQQQCLHGPNETPEQKVRRTEALRATRTVNNLQANQPGARTSTFLRQVELPTSAFAQGPNGQNEFFKKLNFTPGAEMMPGWELKLDVTQDGYWFMIKDKTDPCGFALISNTAGVIYTAEPIR